MKRLPGMLGPVLMVLSFSGGLLIAEEGLASMDENEVKQGQKMIREGRVEMVRSELRLTDEESSAFWSLYAKYREEADDIQDRYAAMIQEYLRRYDDADLTDAYADELIDNFFDIKYQQLGVQKKYLPKFRAVIPSLKVARLFQLENKLNAEIDAQLALVIPLVDPS